MQLPDKAERITIDSVAAYFSPHAIDQAQSKAIVGFIEAKLLAAKLALQATIIIALAVAGMWFLAHFQASPGDPFVLGLNLVILGGALVIVAASAMYLLPMVLVANCEKELGNAGLGQQAIDHAKAIASHLRFKNLLRPL